MSYIYSVAMIKMGATQVETQTQTRVEERLFPSFFDSKLWTPLCNDDQNSKPFEPLFHRSKFLRSSSLNRIKQFPAYLCNQSSTDILIWLYAAKAALSQTFKAANKQLQSLVFILAIYFAIAMVAAQFCACVVVLSSADMSPGYVFMLSNIAVLCVMGLNILSPTPPAKKRKQN